MRAFLPKFTKLTGQRILFSFCYRSPNEDRSWMDVFNNFLHEVCDQFDNMVISGDVNLPDILWDSTYSASGVNEVAFIETVHDHLMTQLNKKRTCGNSVPNCVNVSHTDCFQKIRGAKDIFQKIRRPKDTDHSVIILQFNTFTKALPKSLRLSTIMQITTLRVCCQQIIANDDINTDWYQWKDTFLAAVSDYIYTDQEAEGTESHTLDVSCHT